MKILLFISLVIGLAFQYFYFSNLPAEVAHNFGKGGTPNSWLTKDAYILFSTLSLIGCSFIFLFIDTLLKKVPARYINFPYKNYWLTEQRRKEAFKRMALWTDFFGLVLNLFLIMTFYLVYQANLANPPLLNNTLFLSSLIVFLGITAIWIIALYVKFKPPYSG